MRGKNSHLGRMFSRLVHWQVSEIAWSLDAEDVWQSVGMTHFKDPASCHENFYFQSTPVSVGLFQWSVLLLVKTKVFSAESEIATEGDTCLLTKQISECSQQMLCTFPIVCGA